MKHWLLGIALVCFGSIASALPIDVASPSGSINGTAVTPTSVNTSSLTVAGTGVGCLSAGATFYVDCSLGRVGFGTTTPATKVEVTSGTLAIGGSTANLRVSNGTNLALSAGTSPSGGLYARYITNISGIYFYDTIANAASAGATGRTLYMDNAVLGFGSGMTMGFSKTTDGAGALDGNFNRPGSAAVQLSSASFYANYGLVASTGSFTNQVFARVGRDSTTQAIAQSSSTAVLWENVKEQNQSFFVAASSHSMIVPVGGSGGYTCSCTIGYAAAVSNYVYAIIALNGTTVVPYATGLTSAVGVIDVTATATFKAVDGDRISCLARNDTAGINIGASGNTGFSCVKAF